ncbi:MAG: hypothetical protein ACHQPI_07405 [Thermoanaerobaculia bacterium]
MRDAVTNHLAGWPDPPGPDGHHTCTRCPVCGKEECAVLQDLGMACDTAQAAGEAHGSIPPKVASDRHQARFRRAAGASLR